jgi:hypothetical protein
MLKSGSLNSIVLGMALCPLLVVISLPDVGASKNTFNKQITINKNLASNLIAHIEEKRKLAYKAQSNLVCIGAS